MLLSVLCGKTGEGLLDLGLWVALSCKMQKKLLAEELLILLCWGMAGGFWKVLYWSESEMQLAN